MFNLVRAIATLNHPSYAQVVVVDPPGLEIARWHNSPWFWRNGEVVREVKQFIALQETILREIKRRNKIFEEAGNCLSIASYNKKAIANNWDIMPRLLVFNSELGMFKVPGKQHRVYAQDKREEIGKTARKFGIHIIESSQRPKSEISPTVIGYCGHRMAFYLNQSDSAAVLEGNKEANQLHSPGDFLYFRSDGTTWGHSLYTPEEEMDQVIAQATDLTLSSRLNLSNRVGTLFTDIDPEQVDTSQAA